MNHGTRTFQEPEGNGLLDREIEGNYHAQLTFEMCDRLFDAGSEYLMENSAPSGRYPKLWNT
eukprot:6625962-Lingulodinium_polyedra.AAC.1